MAKGKVIRSNDCQNGNHLFIVTNWQFSQTAQKANSFTCQKCLYTVEGAFEVNKLREALNANPVAEATNS